MATNAEVTSRQSETATDSNRSGYSKDAGPYVGTVVGHVTGNRMGQLLVYIPEFGTNKDDTAAQIPCSYVSPFYGTTFGTDTQLLPDGANTSGQSYGMWMVPPDIGNNVLVIFANGDRQRAYWIGCVYNSTSHHMVPGLARNVGGDADTIVGANADLNSRLSKDSNVPVVESNLANPNAFTQDGINKTSRYPHEFQTSVLISQGLDRDKVRGAISSSSLRESPSNVYGISTPGRKATKTDQIAGDPLKVAMRRGGHQFVMDDGSETDGSDQLIRLRTAGGHQLLMNDSEQVFYIASASGYHWMEFSNNGMINMYGAAGFNLRSAGAINLHSDSQVAINSNGTVAIHGEKGVNITSTFNCSMIGLASASVKSDGFLSLSGCAMASLSSLGEVSVGSPTVTKITGLISLLLNSGKPPLAIPFLPKVPNSLPDVKFNGSTWGLVEGDLPSICSIVPAHEPWLAEGGARPGPNGGSGNSLKSIAALVGTVALGKGISTAIANFSASSSLADIL